MRGDMLPLACFARCSLRTGRAAGASVLTGLRVTVVTGALRRKDHRWWG